MSKLLVDLGNSRLKWALYTGALPLKSAVLKHRGQGLAALLDSAWASQARPDQVWVASVADPSYRETLNQWLQHKWSLTPTFLVSPAQGQGIINSYAEPARLGCDRWAAMVGAFHIAKSAVCVVDCGTAVTLDVVAADGRHLGGLILPGLLAMQSALSRHTTLPTVDFTALPAGPLGTSTTEGIVLGITHAIAAVVQQTLTEQQRPGVEMRCFLTGGDAERIAPLLASPCRLTPDLVLEGLAVIADAT